MNNLLNQSKRRLRLFLGTISHRGTTVMDRGTHGMAQRSYSMVTDSDANKTVGALHGLRVIDVSRVLSVSYHG